FVRRNTIMALDAERLAAEAGSLLFTHSSRRRFAARLNSGVRPAMKWREPWRQSIQQQGMPPDLWRRILRSFLIWYGIFAALLIVYALAGRVSLQDLAGRLAEASVFAAAMSVVLYLVWYLSPRKVDSGPRGIVVTKADEMLLIP